jgi:hypothetical protein
VTAVAASGGVTTSLGCVSRVQMGDPKITLTATRVGSRVSVAGWAIDPQTAAPVTVRVRVGGRLVQTLSAARPNPVPTGTWAPWGAGHGYVTSITSSRPVTLCLTYVNVSFGNDRTACLTR